MKSMKTISDIIMREIRNIIYDRNLISVLLIAPIFYAFFYGSIYFNKTEKDVPIVVVDNDRSEISSKLIRFLDANQLITVTKTCSDFSEAKSEIYSDKAFAVLFIPQNFESNLKSGKGSDVKLLINTNRFLISNDINKSVNEVIATMNGGIRLKYFQNEGYNLDQAKELIEPIKTDMRPLFNITESYGDFLIPAVLILILHQTLLIGLSESVAKERENNSLQDLYTLSNYSISSLILGKVSFYTMLYSSYALFIFGVVFYTFKIVLLGNLIALAVSTFLMILSVTFLSVFISSFFERKIIAIQYITLSSYPIFLLSGYSWPEHSMPLVMKIIAWFIPFTPYSNITVKITQMGASWQHILPALLQILLLIVIYYCCAYLRIKKLINTQRG